MSGILASMFGAGDPAGQYELASAGTISWTVPDGVTLISAVCVGAPYASGATPQHSSIKRGGTTLLASSTTLGGSVGGGNGGAGGDGMTVSYANPQPGEFSRYDHVYFSGGGGGAGGYTGNGGDGAYARTSSSANGNGGSGGAGGGGSGDAIGGDVPGGNYWWNTSAANGGGVGLRGTGSNGAGGVSGDGGRGSYNTAGQPTPGGGTKGASSTSISISGNFPDAAKTAAAKGATGGNLRYLNDIAVTPGETLSLTVPSGGGLRILWGGGRSYPSNAADI